MLRCPLRTHRRPDVCASAGSIPGTESNGQARCLPSCVQCGGWGTGCASVGAASDHGISGIMEDGEACPLKGSAYWYPDDGKDGEWDGCVIFGRSWFDL